MSNGITGRAGDGGCSCADQRAFTSPKVRRGTTLPILKTLRIYPFGVSRDRLAEAARQLHVPIIVTNNQQNADAVITVKNYYRRQPERVQQAEEERKTVIILKNNTIAQMQHALARIFDIPVENPLDDDEDEGGGQRHRSNGSSQMTRP